MVRVSIRLAISIINRRFLSLPPREQRQQKLVKSTGKRNGETTGRAERNLVALGPTPTGDRIQPKPPFPPGNTPAQRAVRGIFTNHNQGLHELGEMRFPPAAVLV
ncbi:hypothetical protein VTI28DRAFT_3459 [Corynascus sepedonium]